MAQARSKLGFARCGLPPRSRGGRSRDSDGDGNVQISPVTQSVSSDGSLGSVSITASAPTCAWTSASSADWLVVLRNSSGTGSGTLDYGVARNPQEVERTGTIVIGGQTFTVTQDRKRD
jgi:hypothetical protein